MSTSNIFKTLDRFNDGSVSVDLCPTSHSRQAVKMRLSVKADTQHIPQPQNQADGRLRGIAGRGRGRGRGRSWNWNWGRGLGVTGQMWAFQQWLLSSALTHFNYGIGQATNTFKWRFFKVVNFLSLFAKALYHTSQWNNFRNSTSCST